MSAGWTRVKKSTLRATKQTKHPEVGPHAQATVHAPEEPYCCVDDSQLLPMPTCMLPVPGTTCNFFTAARPDPAWCVPDSPSSASSGDEGHSKKSRPEASAADNNTSKNLIKHSMSQDINAN